MKLKLTSLLALFGVVAVTSTACVFVPHLMSDSTNTSHGPDEENPGHSLTPDPLPTDPFGDVEQFDASLEDWPDAIPRPPGSPPPGNDTPDRYVVEGDRNAFLDYVEQLRGVSGIEERSGGAGDESAMFYYGEIVIYVLFEAGSEQIIVSMAAM